MPARPVNETVAKLDYHSLFEQYARGDDRGLMLIGPRRTILEMNPAAGKLLDLSLIHI